MNQSLRLATNDMYFATLDGRKAWRITASSPKMRRVEIHGDTETLLKGLKENKDRIESRGVKLTAGKRSYGLLVDVKTAK